MSSERHRRIYWETSVWLAYIQQEEGRFPIIVELLDEATRSGSQIQIVTSVISITEVAFIQEERSRRQLDPTVPQRIDALWDDRSVVSLVEFHAGIARAVRTLKREAMIRGWNRVSTIDLIHLATATAIGADELHTYDEGDFFRYRPLVNFPISTPQPQQPRLL